MPLSPHRPLLYLITSGATNEQTTSSSDEYADVLRLAEAAVAAGIDLVQIREKALTTRVLFQLATRAAEIARGSSTQILINDRADVAAAVGAGGVHLTTQSIPVAAVRGSFGPELLIGVSTHNAEEAVAAKTDGADFIVFGPVFDTPSKSSSAGVTALAQVVASVAPFPVIALGGVKLDQVAECASAGVAGVAAIRMFRDSGTLINVANDVRAKFRS